MNSVPSFVPNPGLGPRQGPNPNQNPSAPGFKQISPPICGTEKVPDQPLLFTPLPTANNISDSINNNGLANDDNNINNVTSEVCDNDVLIITPIQTFDSNLVLCSCGDAINLQLPRFFVDTTVNDATA